MNPLLIPTIVLLTLYVASQLVKYLGSRVRGSEGRGYEVILRVNDMKCSHCALRIRNALVRNPYVSSVNVSLSSKEVRIHLKELRSNALIEELISEIRKLGYSEIERVSDGGNT